MFLRSCLWLKLSLLFTFWLPVNATSRVDETPFLDCNNQSWEAVHKAQLFTNPHFYLCRIFISNLIFEKTWTGFSSRIKSNLFLSKLLFVWFICSGTNFPFEFSVGWKLCQAVCVTPGQSFVWERLLKTVWAGREELSYSLYSKLQRIWILDLKYLTLIATVASSAGQMFVVMEFWVVNRVLHNIEAA